MDSEGQGVSTSAILRGVTDQRGLREMDEMEEYQVDLGRPGEVRMVGSPIGLRCEDAFLNQIKDFLQKGQCLGFCLFALLLFQYIPPKMYNTMKQPLVVSLTYELSETRC